MFQVRATRSVLQFLGVWCAKYALDFRSDAYVWVGVLFCDSAVFNYAFCSCARNLSVDVSTRNLIRSRQFFNSIDRRSEAWIGTDHNDSVTGWFCIPRGDTVTDESDNDKFLFLVSRNSFLVVIKESLHLLTIYLMPMIDNCLSGAFDGNPGHAERLSTHMQ